MKPSIVLLVRDTSTWRDQRGSASYRLPGPDHLGWWAAVAMLISILLHVIVFFSLDRLKIALDFDHAREITTQQVNIQRVEVAPELVQESLPPENVVQPPRDSAALMEEVDVLNALPKNQELDMKPEVDKAEYALKMQNPAAAGDPTAISKETASSMDMDSKLPELGREASNIRPAEIGQMIVDPGSLDSSPDAIGKITDDLLKRGANGKVEKGALNGVSSLDELLNLPANLLLGKKTLLPSDLLFEFNQSKLRESAKVGLMKLGLLMDKNPALYCWIEGHTDLIGGDQFNLNLSIKRAEAVKSYLVNSMKMDPSKIITRGFGRYEPIVTSGTAEEQSINRRVEVRMRKAPPTSQQRVIEPQKAAIIEESPRAPKAILVKPKRIFTTEKPMPNSTPPAPTPPSHAVIEQTPPKAMPLTPPPAGVLRALPAEPQQEAPTPPSAEEVTPPPAAPITPPRAQAVGE
jgi:OOP family OmpA-OmpF porin